MAYNLFVRIGCYHVLTIADVVCLGWDAFGNREGSLPAGLGSPPRFKYALAAMRRRTADDGLCTKPRDRAMALSRLTFYRLFSVPAARGMPQTSAHPHQTNTLANPRRARRLRYFDYRPQTDTPQAQSHTALSTACKYPGVA